MLPPNELEGCLYGEAVLLAGIMPDSDDFLDMVDGVHPDAAIYVEGMRDVERFPARSGSGDR